MCHDLRAVHGRVVRALSELRTYRGIRQEDVHRLPRDKIDAALLSICRSNAVYFATEPGITTS